MIVRLKGNSCQVIREDSDKRIYKESTLWCHIKRELQRQGHDVIAKLMWKDGHLVPDTQHYVRTRNMKDGSGWFMLNDGRYALRFTYEPYNEGELFLELHREEKP